MLFDSEHCCRAVAAGFRAGERPCAFGVSPTECPVVPVGLLIKPSETISFSRCRLIPLAHVAARAERNPTAAGKKRKFSEITPRVLANMGLLFLLIFVLVLVEVEVSLFVLFELDDLDF